LDPCESDLPHKNISLHLRYVWLYLMFHRAYRHAVNGVTQEADDLAMQPVQAHELDTLELFAATSAAQIVVEKIKKKNFKNSVDGANLVTPLFEVP
jgi:hypothetical protein